MRLFRHRALFTCLLLAGVSLFATRTVYEVDTRIAPEYAQGLLLVPTIEGCRFWLDSWSGGSFAWSGGCVGTVKLADGFGRLDLIGSDGRSIALFEGTMRRGHKSPHGREFVPHKRELFSRESSGDGTETIDGVRYEGEFQGDVRAGLGEMTWPNGDTFRGGWRNGLPNGYGEVLMGKELIAGQWRDGCLLDFARTVAVAVALDSCRNLVPERSCVAVADVRMDAAPQTPEPLFSPDFDNGCTEFWGGFRYCGGPGGRHGFVP